jgi:hypothetical protein
VGEVPSSPPGRTPASVGDGFGGGVDPPVIDGAPIGGGPMSPVPPVGDAEGDGGGGGAGVGTGAGAEEGGGLGGGGGGGVDDLVGEGLADGGGAGSTTVTVPRIPVVLVPWNLQ